MNARVLPMRLPCNESRGTVHVFGDRVDGFTVSHESASGNSWGELHGPYGTGQDALISAVDLNHRVYGGTCNISACDAAVEDANPGVGFVTIPGGFR